jgi:glutaredoxin-like protein
MAELLNQSIKDQIRDVFAKLQEPVALLFFGEKQDCDYCGETRQLLEEVVGLSDKLSLQVYDRSEQADIAAQYNVDKVPGLVIAAKDGDAITDYGVRFAGIPAGHEFSSLIQDIVLVSGRDSGLSPQTREFLKGLGKPVHLMVFTTPT